MMYLTEGLKINNSIQKLDFCNNHLGENEKNIMHLTEALKLILQFIN